MLSAGPLAGGLVANVVFNISPMTGMIIFTAILIIYTLVGGMLAVVYTDFLQMIIMIVGTLISVPSALLHFEGLANLIEKVELVHPQAMQWGGLPTVLLITMSMTFFLSSVATPEKVIRLSILFYRVS